MVDILHILKKKCYKTKVERLCNLDGERDVGHIVIDVNRVQKNPI
jgi:hypothetical protein